MTAEQIRSISETVQQVPENEPLHQNHPASSSSPQFVILREIAAQLAELNERENKSMAGTYRDLVEGGWEP